MFSFFCGAGGCDGIPCPVSCCEQQQLRCLAAAQCGAARCTAQEACCTGSVFLPLTPHRRHQHPLPPSEQHFTISLSAVGQSLPVTKAVYVNLEFCLCNCKGSAVTVLWSAAAAASGGGQESRTRTQSPRRQQTPKKVLTSALMGPKSSRE